MIGVKDSSYSDPELWLWKLGAGRGNMSSRRCEDHLTLALHRFLETLDGDPPRRVPDDPALWYLVLPGRSLSGSLPESLKKIATRGSVCVLVRADGVPDLPLLGDAALPAILWFLGQGKEPLRAHAAYGLHNFPDRAAEIIPVLGGVLRDEATRVRRAAARALVSVVTSESEIAVPHLLSALDDGDALVRARAAMALGNTGHGPEPVVSALRRALRDEDGRVRFRAAQSLGELHPAANRAIPDLRAALEDSEGLVRHHAGRALARIRADAPEEDPGGAGSSRE